jgi:hypothetical protein
LLSHDVNTLINDAYDHVANGLPKPGVIIVRLTLPIGTAVNELELIISAGGESDFDSRVIHVPMR